MNAVIEGAVKALSDRISSFDGTAKFTIEGEGSIIIDQTGVHAGEDEAEAEVTMTATRATFEGILNGETTPTIAYMTGKLKIDGSLPTAMKLGAALS